MELRTAEREVTEMRLHYVDLQQGRFNLPLLSVAPAIPETVAVLESSPFSEKSAAETLQLLQELRARTLSLEEIMAKFLKRKNELDPITQKPRYGEKTFARVESLLAMYEGLRKAIALAFGEDTVEAEEQATRLTPAFTQLVEEASNEEQETARKIQMEQERLALELAQKQEEEFRAAEERRLVEEAKQRQLQRQRDELYRQAEEARVAELRAREEARRVDRDWMASIPKGPDGVRQQLRILVEGTKDENGAQKTATTALHTIFSQICAHPEETSFRRIRRDHPRFNQDIGRHPGGKEVLIAAGFTLGAIDDVPSFISVEPSIETDMDGWAAWFDLLKKTLEIVEEQRTK
jgi:hypothetical protein